MRNIVVLLQLCILLLAGCVKDEPTSSATSATHIQSLNDQWEMRQADTDDWMPVATIPSTVHTALFKNGRIEDPFYRDNESRLQWIESKDWEYRKRFDADTTLLSEQVVELLFKGLDTYADVYLNGQKILEADNMFRSWLVDVKSLLRPQNNELRLFFHAPTHKETPKWEALGYELPDGSRRAITRKAAFHYGWDWGPRFATMGPWQPVELRGWSGAVIDAVHYRTIPTGSDATVQAFFRIAAQRAGTATIAVEIAGQLFRKDIQLNEGQNTDSLSFALNDIRLWWPNGYGQQYLYDVSASLSANGFSDIKNDRVGIRSIALQQPAHEDGGTRFFFEVNGQPIFAKGANYIPMDIFQDRVTNDQYERLLGDVIRANMNMLRVWGGGIYEDDRFYQLCDELGILVWQDFMFANAMVPGDEAFRQNVAAEADEQISRLTNHPCIALWCGNNEISEGWHRWGWQEGLSEQQRSKIWADYQAVFNNILPNAVATLSPQTPYWESSPKLGRGDENYLFSGDAHDWSVWHDAAPFSDLEEKVPRFMSEFGFQSLPDMRTIETFTLAKDRSLDSEAMKAHQKHKRGAQLIDEYMARQYNPPKDFESYVYVSQLLQAEGIRRGIEAHLRAYPDCMGSLYWQLNDCWPVVSWSSIDNQGRWKALHYAARRAFRPVHTMLSLNNGKINASLVNHSSDTLFSKGQVGVVDFQGNILIERPGSMPIMPLSARTITGGNANRILGGRDPSSHLVSFKIFDRDSNLVSKSLIATVEPKDLRLTPPNISTTISKSDKGYRIQLDTDVFAKAVYLQIDRDGFFTDNFFDLLPGENKELVFETEETISDFKDRLRIRSLVDSYQ